jgi:signal transduction histidine kinase
VIVTVRRDAPDPPDALREGFDDLEAAIRRLRLPEESRGELAGRLAAVRDRVEQERRTEGEKLHRLGHDLRASLNAIAGWVHILRLDASSAATVQRAVDVFDRNVRALTQLIEAYTATDRR